MYSSTSYIGMAQVQNGILYAMCRGMCVNMLEKSSSKHSWQHLNSTLRYSGTIIQELYVLQLATNANFSLHSKIWKS